MQFATRVERIETSEELAVGDIASELEAEGRDVIDLSVGQPDVQTPPAIVEAGIGAIEAGHTGYTPTAGLTDLRRAIAEKKFAERDGIEYGPENVLVTPGARLALFLSFQSFVEEGDDVILFEPVFTSFDSVVKLAGGRPIRVDLSAHGFKLEPALDDLAAAITPETEMVVVNAPVNPSGMCFSDAALDGLRDLAVDHDLVVISDEIYDELTYGAEQTSIATLDGMVERTITVNGFSKAYAMTGWRLGYMGAPVDVLDRLTRIYSHAAACAPNFVQHAGIAALEDVDIDEFAESVMETFRSRREYLVERCAERGIDVPVPDATFFVMIPLDTLDDVTWGERAIEDAGVALVPGSAYGTPGYVRVSLVQPKARIGEAVDRLVECELL